MKYTTVKINPNIKALILPIFTIMAVVIMFILVAPSGISRIDKKLKEFKTVQSEENALKSKLDSLRGISPELLDPEDVTVIALPSKNPGTWVVSQIKKISSETEVGIVDLSLSKSNDKGELQSSEIDFEIESPEFASLLKFVSDLTVILPVSSLNTVSFKRGSLGSNYTGDLKVSFYWSDFPTSLPPINEPVKELTPDEAEIIGLVSNYSRPVFGELQPGIPEERPQPFN